MTAATMTLERASLLRAVADKLPLLGGFTDGQAAMLREMADEQQQKEEYDAWVRAKVAKARAETGPGRTGEEMLAYVRAHIASLQGVPEGD